MKKTTTQEVAENDENKTPLCANGGLDPYLTPHTTFKLNLSVRAGTVTFVGKKLHVSDHNLGLGNGFLIWHHKHAPQKETDKRAASTFAILCFKGAHEDSERATLRRRECLQRVDPRRDRHQPT